MKREMNLIRGILLSIETGKEDLILESFSQEVVRYHQALLIEANLVDGLIHNSISNLSEAPSQVIVKKLTWSGHEFLDSIREEAIWDTIKKDFKESSVETIIKVSKQLAEGWAKKKVDALLEDKS